MKLLKHTVALLAMCLGALAGAQTPSDSSIGQIVSQMNVEQKARIVVGLEREFFPPTNAGFAARTTPNADFGVPSLVLADGTAGLRLSRRGKERSTAFPSNTALASSWNRDLARKVGAAAGMQARAYNANVLLAPGINIIRNPLCGRNFEYFSEDPLLSGKIGASYIQGIQSNGVAASVKHFTCNNQETNRSRNDVRVSQRALREIYLKGFEICVKESDPWTVMASYNQLCGLPVQESKYLLTGILRDEWGFGGLVMTDWSIAPHNTSLQIGSGIDLLMPGMESQVQDILRAVEDGSLAEADLDRACAKVIELGRRCWFEESVSAPPSCIADGEEVSQEAAGESAVLLKNNAMLPLSGDSGKAALFGVRSYDMVARGSGSGFVVCPFISQLNEAFTQAGLEIDSELDDLYTKYVAFASADIKYNEKIKVWIGLPLLPELEVSRLLIDKAAKNDAYAVITLGRSGEEGVDRPLEDNYYLTVTEKELVRNVCEAFHAQGKKVAVITNISGAIEMESWKDMPDAILNIWLPGQLGGIVTRDLLLGKVNPSGRLSVSIAKDYFDYPTARTFPYDNPTQGNNFDYTEYSEGIYVGYRHFTSRNVDVTYPFGYGLSYTTFAYSKPSIKVSGREITVKVTVTNTGSMEGKEAVGIYAGAPAQDKTGAAAFDMPAKELRAFGKTRLLAPGEAETMTFRFPVSDLDSFNESTGKWEHRSGRYIFFFGADVNAPQATLSATVK